MGHRTNNCNKLLTWLITDQSRLSNQIKSPFAPPTKAISCLNSVSFSPPQFPFIVVLTSPYDNDTEIESKPCGSIYRYSQRLPYKVGLFPVGHCEWNRKSPLSFSHTRSAIGLYNMKGLSNSFKFQNIFFMKNKEKGI